MSEMFLAEAAVAVVPDLTAFRAKLIADLKVATAGVVANVTVAATGASKAAAAASTAGRAASQTAGKVGGTAAAQTRALTEANTKLAASQRIIEAAERRVLVTTNEVSIARIRGRAATDAAFLAEEAYAAALRTNDGATRAATATAVGLARKRKAEALATLETAGAEKVLASERAKGTAATAAQQGFAARGFVAQALGLAGLRGAVLSANSAFLAGTVAALGFFASLKSAAGLESTLNVFAVTAGATADEMIRVGDEAKNLGADLTLPGVSAGDAAETFLELSKAGLTVEESLEGARGTLQLATAAAISNSEATVIAASALNAFGLAGDQTVRVADVLTNAANLSQGSIADVGLSMQQAAAVARQVGVSFEDTIALLTLLAQNGIRGSDAGTSLRVAFTKLINPTDKARAVLESLNIQVRDLNGNVRPEVFADFAAAQANLTREQQDRNAGIVFGTDALRAYSIASREGLAGLDAVREGLEKQGSAAEIAGARTVGLAGSWENLKNQASTLGVTIGQGLSGPTQDFVDILAGGIANISSFVDWLDRSGDQSKVTGEAYHNLAIRAAEIRAAQGDEAALEFLRHLESGANQASLSFTNLVIEAGTINRAVNARDGVKQLDDFTQATEHTGRAGEKLRTHQQELNAALEATQPAALKARDGIEAYRASIVLAGEAEEGLTKRIDESRDRFASEQKAVEPKPPPTIGPEAKNAAAQQIASAKGDLQEVERLQEEELARLRALRGRTTGNIERRTEIFNDIARANAALITTRGQIEAKAESDAKQADDDRKDRARKAQKRREDADRAIVDAIGDRNAAFDTREFLVEATKGLADDITLARNRKRFLKRQIEIAQKSIKDDELRSDTIRDLRDQRKKLTVEIEGLLVEQAEAAVVKATGRFDASLNLAQALGNIPLQIKLIDRRIAEINKLVEARKKESGALKLAGKARDDALAEAANLATQREGLEDQRIQEGIGLGQSILDLTKNKNPLLKALNRAAAETRKDIAAAKKAGRSTVVLQTELNNFLQQRKEVLKTVDDEKRGPTAFDLLSQFSGIFGETAGNLIGGSQPFQTAGGINGFTADIAAHLRRTGAGGKTLGGLAGKTKAERNILKLDDTAIVTAMNGLKDAFLGRSGPGTGEVPRRQSPGSGAVERNDNRWREAGRARSAVEQRRSGI